MIKLNRIEKIAITFFLFNFLLITFLAKDANASGLYKVMYGNIKDRSNGTVFAVRTKNGIRLITAKHVCDNIKFFVGLGYKLRFKNEETEIRGVIEKENDTYDICSIRPLDKVEHPFILASSMMLSERVSMYGFPDGVMNHVKKVEDYYPQGDLYMDNYNKTVKNVYFVNVGVKSGFSGGPVFSNRTSEVVGVVFATSKKLEMTYFVGVKAIRSVIE